MLEDAKQLVSCSSPSVVFSCTAGVLVDLCQHDEKCYHKQRINPISATDPNPNYNRGHKLKVTRKSKP